MKKNSFSVLMSVYFKETSSNLREALKSIYENQILKPSEIILVEDGILTEELYNEINFHKKKLGEILKVVKLEKNQGLGNALNIGLLECSNELVARMDTDDIAFPERFEKQITFMMENLDIDICGTFMLEFKDDINNVSYLKDAPIENINTYIKYRSPLNHPTVVFKKSKVLEAGNYLKVSLYEDYYLWIRMKAKNANFANIAEPLLYFRIDDNTYKRRGGFKYIISEWYVQKEAKKLGVINMKEFIFNIISKSIVRLLPNFIRKYVYTHFLRKNLNIKRG